MTDLAVLGLRFETDGADNATQKLDQVAQKAAGAERATDALSGANKRAGSAIAQMVASIERGVRDLVAMAQAQLILAGHTQTATVATTALTAATVQGSTANVRYAASWTGVQTSMGGTAAEAARASTALKQLDSHVVAYQQSLTRGTREIGQADAHMVAYRATLGKVGKDLRLTASEGLNLSRQMADIGVTAAMGMNPLMIALQQGPQLFDIMQTAAVRTGATISATMAATGAAVWAALAPLLPLIVGIGLAITAIVAPFAIAAQQINAQNKGLIDGLGLTADQLENVKNKGVTMGDVLTGVWVATSKALTDAFGPEIEAVGKWFSDLYQEMVDGAVAALKGIVGGFTGGFAAIKATWAILPRALGDAAFSAANLVLRGVQGMINGGVGLLNTLISAANAAADAIPGVEAFIPMLNPVAIAALANPFAGAMTQVGADGGAAFAAGFERGAGRVDGFLENISNEIEAAARRRIRREAGDAEGGGGTAAHAREVREVETLWANVNREVRALGVQYVHLVDKLEQAAREMALIGNLARDAGQGMADSFGRAGDALGGMLTALTGYGAQLAAINLAEKEFRLSGAQATRERTAAEVRSYGDMTDAARSFFDEKSAGYKALTVATQVFRAIEFGLAVKAMVVDNAETIGKIASSAKRAAAYAAEAIANAFKSIPFPFNIAAGAAVAAALVGLGISIFGGGGGGGGSVTMPSTNTGTGTVLGNGGDQSESLTRSLEMAERYQNKDLDFSNKQLASLKAIQANIGSLTTAIAKEMNVGGGLDPSGLNQGPRTSGGFLGLFQNTTTSNVVGSGINLSGGQLADLIASGVSGALYQIVQTTRTNNGFFGIGGSTRTTNSEVTSGIDQGLSQEFARVLASLRDGVLTAAGQLGLAGAEAVLDAFQVNLGRISFEGMSSSEINDALNAVFSAVGDDMARAILPGLDAFQRAGEGLLETLSRLATEYRTVDVTLQSIGMTFGAVGLSSVEARTRLVELVGGLDAFTEGASFFAENFLTEAQRIAPVQAAVTAELTRLGLATDITRTQFADLVMGLDVSTASGAEMFAALMRLAPALDQTLRYTEDMMGGITNAADLDRQRRELEIRLMEAQGRIAESLAARRADELAAMDAALRPMQLAVWAAQDMAQAAAELAAAEQQAAEAQRALASQRRDLEIQLMEAQGNAAGALAARRELELAALDASLRPLQMAIYAALDLAAAADELARAQADAAAAAEEAARAAEALASERRTLEIDLMEATGDAAGALAARRELELAALDASLRPLQLAIFAALDLAAANEALANAQAEATAQAEAEAQRVAQLAASRRDLEIQLLDAEGRTSEAVAARRALEVEALDASLRPLQLAIYAALDLAAAAETLAQAERDAAAVAEAEAQRLAQIATSRRDLEIQLLEAQGNAVEALAARRQIELATLDESLRPLQESIWATLDLSAARATEAQAAADAAEAARNLARQRRDLDIQLLEATGDATGALAARRMDELAALDASLRPIQEAIWAALDLADANQRLADAQAEAAAIAEREAERIAAIASQRVDMEIQLLDAQGRASEATAARRALEIAALDESLRPLQLAIFAALDMAAAADTLAVAQQQAAEEAARAAEQVAAIARQQRDLDIQLMDATGNASGALSARRADELAAMDESLRATQRAIWAALDLAQATDAAAQALQEAADTAARIADQRRGLEIQLMEATGNAAGALAARRQDELAALDASLRPIQLQIYAAQDLAEAQARAAEAAAAAYERLQDDARARVEDARSNLTQAYQREASALQGTIDRFRDFGDSIREFRANLDASGPGSASYSATRAVFEQTAALAKLGNQDALGSLTGASQAFLDAALNNASSALAYNRDVSAVKAALDAAAGTADRNVSVAEQQLAQLDASVAGLTTLNESVLSVRDGILALQAAMSEARRLGVTQFASGGVFTSPTMFQMGGALGQMAEAGPEAIMPLVDGPNGLGVRAQTDGALLAEIRSLRSEVAGLRAEQKAGHAAIATNTGKGARTLAKWDDDGLPEVREAA